MKTNSTKAILIFLAFLASGFLSGAIIHWSKNTESYSILYMPGLLFGFIFVFINALVEKKLLLSFLALILSTAAYYLAVLLFVDCEFHPAAVGACGAAALTFSLMILFRIKFPFALAAIVAGGACGLLMLITDIDDGYQLAYTFSIWQGAVGLLLSLGLRE